MPKTHIVLIHGLYMSNVVMQYLRVGLLDCGYSISCFQYKSRQFDEQVFEDLDAHISALSCDKGIAADVVLVGHSMGGLIARQYHARYGGKVSKIVTLGTPHKGSALGKSLAQFGILGSAGKAGITDPISEWDGSIPLGSIAGNMKIGALCLVSEENDGTVLLSETHCHQETDHVVIKASHTGLVYSKVAVNMIDLFIKTNRFSQRTCAQEHAVRV